jgi:glycosyltransferase involved in cell wall biosynthesis
MANKIADRLPSVKVVDKLSGSADVVYFMHYHMYRRQDKPCCAWFTHLEPESHHLRKRWFEVAKLVDVCIASCHRYLQWLPEDKSRAILPGVDERYQPRKLRVGVACQWAHGNEHRKGLDLLKQLQAEQNDWLDLILTNGEIPQEAMVDWFQSLDVYLVSSRYEGGPLPAIEAAACGVPVVAPDVGFVRELAALAPITFYRTGDYDDMVNALKQYQGSNQIRTVFSWDNFANQHKKVFEELSSHG